MDNHSNEMMKLNEPESTQINIKVCDLKEENVIDYVPGDISDSPSIIRIIPNKITLPQNSPLRTFVLNCSNNLESKTSLLPSTSNATADHEYVYKEEDTHMNIIYINHSEQLTEGVEEQQSIEIEEPKINDLKRCIEDNISRCPEKISKVHSENCCEVCRDTLETILKRQEEILKYLINGPPSFCRDSKFDLLPPMPFNDLNDFLDFDESLSNENVLDQLISKLQRLLVSIEKRSVSNILGSLLTNELCKKISWIGIKDTIAFQNTNIVNHIIDVIQDHHEIDVDIIKSYLAEWLRRCSDRIASETRKNKKKAQQCGLDDT